MMYCQRCQARPALAQVQDAAGLSWALCEICASQSQVFGSLHKLMLPALTQASPPPAQQSCPSCHQTWHILQQTSHLGCPECYRFFRVPLEAALTRLHGQTVHQGRRPHSRQERDANWMRQELEKAVAEERFEEAAQWRDRLRSLERNS